MEEERGGRERDEREREATHPRGGEGQGCRRGGIEGRSGGEGGADEGGIGRKRMRRGEGEMKRE